MTKWEYELHWLAGQIIDHAVLHPQEHGDIIVTVPYDDYARLDDMIQEKRREPYP